MNNKLKKIGPHAKKIDFWQKIEYIKAKCARLVESRHFNAETRGRAAISNLAPIHSSPQ
jgi:hypothetical protein